VQIHSIIGGRTSQRVERSPPHGNVRFKRDYYCALSAASHHHALRRTDAPAFRATTIPLLRDALCTLHRKLIDDIGPSAAIKPFSAWMVQLHCKNFPPVYSSCTQANEAWKIGGGETNPELSQEIPSLQMTNLRTGAQGLFKRTQPIAGEARTKPSNEEVWRCRAFSKLYARISAVLHTLPFVLLGNGSSEDMKQEAFLHLFRKLGHFPRERPFHMAASAYVNLVLCTAQEGAFSLSRLEETINHPKRTAHEARLRKPRHALSARVERVALERAAPRCPARLIVGIGLHDVRAVKHNEICDELEWLLYRQTANITAPISRLKLRELLR